MMSERAGVRFAIILAASALCACSGQPASDSVQRATAYDHSLRKDQIIDPIAMECTDGHRRVLGTTRESQLVTISSENDCVECERHLAGLDSIFATHRLPIDQFVVTHAPDARIADVLTLYRARTMRPLCIDTNATFWRQTRVAHTPVTILLTRGRIRYIDDAPLETPEERSQFRAQVLAAARQ